MLAPTTTFDLTLRSGDKSPSSIAKPAKSPGIRPAHRPRQRQGLLPAFDVTPANFITAIICENSIARPPFGKSLKRLAK